MSGKWRPFAVATATLLTVGGIVMVAAHGGPGLLVVGIVALVAVLAEGAYRAPSMRRPAGSAWRATDERFTDPETGLATRVWYDDTTGERHYVAESSTSAP